MLSSADSHKASFSSASTSSASITSSITPTSAPLKQQDDADPLEVYRYKLVDTKTQQHNIMQESAPVEHTDKDTKWRVKVYELSPTSSWDDRGTGHIEIEQSTSEPNSWFILVRSELDHSVLLQSAVLRSDVYNRQQDTLIVWTELDGRDLALSFQEVPGCEDIWFPSWRVPLTPLTIRQIISEIQKRMTENETVEIIANDELMVLEQSELNGLQKVELGNLAYLDQAVNELMSSMFGRERLIQSILNAGFLDRLLEVFHTAEDLDMKPELMKIYSIMRSIILLNDHHLFEYLLKEDVCIQICSVFEYDPDYPVPFGKHQSYLSQKRFRTIGKFQDRSLEAKIHQTFRAQYLRDVVLARIIEDPSFNSLHSIVMFNQVEILNSVSSDDSFITEICEELKDPNTTAEKKKLNLQFIQDFCHISRTVQMVKRQLFYQSLASRGFLLELQPFLQSTDFSLRMIVSDILAHMLDHDATLLRSFIMTQKKHSSVSLSEVLIRCLLEDSDEGMKYQYFELLRMLLDWTSSDQSDHDNSDFVNLFFSEQLHLVVSGFASLELVAKAGNETEKVLELGKNQMQSCLHIVDLFIFLVKVHPGKTKSFLLRDSFLSKMSLLLHSRHGFVKLYPIRLFRAVVGTRDEFYCRAIVKNNLLSGLVEVFVENGTRYNMLNSAVLELFEFIRHSNVVTLVKYLVTNFKESLSKLSALGPVREFMENGQRLLVLEAKDSGATIVIGPQEKHVIASSVTRSAWTSVDRDEEDYFNDDTPEDLRVPPPSLTDEPPIPVDKFMEEDEDPFSRRLKSAGIGRNATTAKIRTFPLASRRASSAQLVVGSVRNSPSKSSGKGLVDYPDDANESLTRVPVSPRTRGIVLGAKRMALDEADPRDWNREMVMDIGSSSSIRTGSPPISSGTSPKPISRATEATTDGSLSDKRPQESTAAQSPTKRKEPDFIK